VPQGSFPAQMDFEFSAEQEMLRESVRAFLAARAPIASVRAAYDDATFDPSVWDGLDELGVLELDMVDAAVVLEELGRAVCPTPYASSAVAARSLVPDLAGIATLALYEPGSRYVWTSPSARVGGDGLLHGTKVHVPDACTASSFVVTALDADGEFGVFVAESGDVEATPTVDGSRKFGRVTFDGVAARRVTADASDVARAVDRLGVAYVVDGVGAAQRALELAVEYAKERVQFDKPIGSFQAVQHLCADMLRTVELARAAAYYACWAIDDAPAEEAHRAATLACAFASSAFPQLGGTAIQVFGGIGFTWEHDIHLFYKRLLTCASALGSAADHLENLAVLVLAASDDV
jgi:alkylation response protein AidB-like acyl-CoA dehydrogenase